MRSTAAQMIKQLQDHIVERRMIIRRRNINQPFPGQGYHRRRIRFIIPEVIPDAESSPEEQCDHRKRMPQQQPTFCPYKIICFPAACLHGTFCPSASYLLIFPDFNTCDTAPYPHLFPVLHTLVHGTACRSLLRLP